MTNKLTPGKIRGIDSIRFICALWVVFGHLGVIDLQIEKTTGMSFSNLMRGLTGSVFNGPAAVIVFFLISGFCIHHPYRNRRQIPVSQFFCRRYLRIGIPLLVAFLLASWLDVRALIIQPSSLVISFKKIQYIEDNDIGIIWSLVCELIYYTLYPFLFGCIRKYGWSRVLIASFVLALLVISTRPAAHSFPAYGNLLTWCVGLPCWLLGCRLGEAVDDAGSAPVPRLTIWGWRLGIWALSSVALMLRFHTVVGYPWTLNAFGVVCYFWLKMEMRYFADHQPFSLLEWAGTWSYSIYLVHKLVLPFCSVIGLSIPDGPLVSITYWGARTLLVLGFCLGFYYLVEYPAHKLARWAAGKLPRVND